MERKRIDMFKENDFNIFHIIAKKSDELEDFEPVCENLKGYWNYPTIVYFHGYLASRKTIYFKTIKKIFHEKGYPILVCNQFGHGGRSGNILDLVNTIEEYKEYFAKYPKTRYILIGHSIGAEIALALAKVPNVDLVFSLSAFFQEIELPSYIRFYRALRFWNKEPNQEAIASQFKPALVKNTTYTRRDTKKIHLFHGNRDRIVPISHLYDLKKYLKLSNEQIHEIEGGHGSLPYQEIGEKMLEIIEKSIK